MNCSRTITFIIPGNFAAPDVQIKVVEVDGTLVFTLEVLGGGGLIGDLRGLFFDVKDESKLAGLTYFGPLVTELDTGNVTDLGNGANMNGAAPFDVGLEFGTQGMGKDDIQTATFTLWNPDYELTLDDIAHTTFGARLTSIGTGSGSRNGNAKLTTTSPAAPDAVDDSVGGFEDGQSGLDDPSHLPEGILFQVLQNDTDADFDPLTITSVFGASNGMVQMVDGDDADLLPDDAILYTPFADFAGADSFTYCVTDNNGGTDSADVAVTIAAVADVPDIEVQVLAGNTVNEIRLIVTATRTDSSEYIDQILTSALPDGVALDLVSVDSDEPGQIVQEFLLTLPLDQTSHFGLTFTAVSKETSNGDEQTGSQTIAIDYEHTVNEFNPTFLATENGIWTENTDPFIFEDERFIGVTNVGNSRDSSFSFIDYNYNVNLTAGFQSHLTVTGGFIDANLPYDISIDTSYNKLTDVLVIGSDAVLTGGGFEITGPGADYVLDFIFNYFVDALVELESPFPAVFSDVELFDVTKAANKNINILDLELSDVVIEIPLGGGFSVKLGWPDLDLASDDNDPEAGVFAGDVASNNFFSINLDMDQFLAFVTTGSPVSPFEFKFGDPEEDFVYAQLELVDLDLFAGLNALQTFTMQAQGLTGTLTFEDGSEVDYTIGSDLAIQNASELESNGIAGIQFTLSLDPDVLLTNDTDIGVNLGYALGVFALEAGFDFGFEITGSVDFGPVYGVGGTLPVASFDVYDNTFALDFIPQDMVFVV